MSSKRLMYILFVVTVVGVMVLSACGTPATPAPAPTDVPTEAPVATATEVAAAPTATATIPPADCTKMDGAPTAAAGELGSADKPIVIAFVPSGDTGKITKAGTAIADCLSEMTGLTFNIEVGTSYAASIEALGAEKA